VRQSDTSKLMRYYNEQRKYLAKPQERGVWEGNKSLLIYFLTFKVLAQVGYVIKKSISLKPFTFNLGFYNGLFLKDISGIIYCLLLYLTK
jgi:hypothetical protein